MRDGVPGLAGRRADGRARREPAAVLLAGDGPPPPPLPAPLRRAGHRRPHGDRPRRGAGDELGRMRTAIAFADLAGYTQLTEEQGDEEAREHRRALRRRRRRTRCRDEARIVKTIGDEVMLVSQRPGRADRLGGRLPGARGRAPAAADRHPRRRGRSTATATTTAARSTSRRRVAARAAGRRGARDRARSSTSPRATRSSSRIGEVKLKGFSEPTELYLAIGPDGG